MPDIDRTNIIFALVRDPESPGGKRLILTDTFTPGVLAEIAAVLEQVRFEVLKTTVLKETERRVATVPMMPPLIRG